MVNENPTDNLMSDVLANIAHQWRQPLCELGGILMEIETASKFSKLDQQYVRKCVLDANVLIEHMSKTIDDFTNFFKPDKKKGEFSVDASIEYVLFLMANTIQSSGIKIEKHLAKVELNGYKREFEQVVLNLLLNALENFEARGIADGVIHINLAYDQQIILEIRDNGGGVPPDVVERIFYPYFSTKNNKKNSGLGLYIAKMVIEKSMQGTLCYEPIENGSLFRIVL